MNLEIVVVYIIHKSDLSCLHINLKVIFLQIIPDPECSRAGLMAQWAGIDKISVHASIKSAKGNYF